MQSMTNTFNKMLDANGELWIVLACLEILQTIDLNYLKKKSQNMEV
ncbi:hypothetical protein DOY81_002896 [Sarcophaga bullata]|nr:hypothetical protein DOY81_002896 [Sarcophaga bullata]